MGYVRCPPAIRLCDAYPFIGWIIKAAIEECALTVQVLPEELLSNRGMLTHYLTEQLQNLTARKARELQESQELIWSLMFAAELARRPDGLPNWLSRRKREIFYGGTTRAASRPKGFSFTDAHNGLIRV